MAGSCTYKLDEKGIPYRVVSSGISGSEKPGISLQALSKKEGLLPHKGRQQSFRLYLFGL